MAKCTKRTIKFLAGCTNEKLVKAILKLANISVIKSICNAALNATSGDIGISPKHKKLFDSYRSTFQFLISRSISLETKTNRLIANRNHELALIPTLLSCVLDSIGCTFVVGDGSIQKVCDDEQVGSRSPQREEDSEL